MTVRQEIRLGYDSSWIRHTCVYIKADMFSNAIAGLAPMGGSGIYGSCRSTPTFPNSNTMCAGYFDGDILVNARRYNCNGRCYPGGQNAATERLVWKIQG